MLTRKDKQEQIEFLSQKLTSASSVVFASFSGLKIKDMESLRKSLKKQGISFQVVKNTLLKRACESKGKQLDQDMLSKPLAVAFGNEDELAAPKALAAFAKENEALHIAGGIFEDNIVDGDSIKSIALLPGREELYAKIVGSLVAPLSRLVRSIQFPSSVLVSVLHQRAEKINQ